MPRIDRRAFVQSALALGATAAWASARALPAGPWHERRDLFPEGVASGDPEPNSILLWTRRTYEPSSPVQTLRVELSDDPAFTRILLTAPAPVSAASDWTCRVLAGAVSRPRPSIGTASSIPKATAAALAAPSPPQPSKIPGPSASPSSVVRTPTRARRTRTAA